MNSNRRWEWGREAKARFERRVLGKKILSQKPPSKNTLTQKPPLIL